MALKLKGSTSGFTAIDAPATAGDNTLVLPANNGSASQYLQTDGSGGLSWQTVTTGQILQVQTVTYREYQSYTMNNSGIITNNGTDMAGFDATVLDLTITPASTNSRILLLCNISSGSIGNNYGVMRLKRGINGATPSLYTQNTGAMSATANLNGAQHQIGTHGVTVLNSEQHRLTKVDTVFVDEPSTTDEVVYRFNFLIETDGSSNTWYLNRVYYQNNDYGSTSAISTVTALEIAS